MNTKKQLIVLVLRMLETHSDKNHPLTQVEITKTISSKFPCDRKTVGRNIQFLRELNFPIIKTSKGFYMDNQMFSKKEIDFILESVKNSENVADFDTNIDKDDLCGRLYSSLSRYYN